MADLLVAGLAKRGGDRAGKDRCTRWADKRACVGRSVSTPGTIGGIGQVHGPEGPTMDKLSAESLRIVGAVASYYLSEIGLK